MHNHSIPSSVVNRKSRYKVPVIIFVCLIVCACIISWYLVRRVFVVEQILCQMDREECPESVSAELTRLQSKPLLFLELSQVENKILGALPQLQSVVIHKQFPKTLQVILESSQESLIVYFPESSTYAFISQQGKVLNTTPVKPERMLFISLPARSLRQGDELTQDELKDVTRLNGFMRDSMQIYGIERVNGKEINIFLPNSKRAVISSDGLEKQLATLQLLLNEATMIENISVMDLRFSHPVLR